VMRSRADGMRAWSFLPNVSRCNDHPRERDRRQEAQAMVVATSRQYADGVGWGNVPPGHSIFGNLGMETRKW
jgi:hypothetical protein